MTASPGLTAALPADLDFPPKPLLYTERLQFDGRAGDYWRLWALHLCLNVLTLGLYSPWAKRRRQQWFARHTRLLGDPFDYQAQPLRLLLGRVVGLIVLGLYSNAGEFSWGLALACYGLLLLAAPLLYASAQRFKLRATRWRGLSFDFRVRPGTAYAFVLPMLLIWLAPALIVLAGLEDALVQHSAAKLLSVTAFLAVPWAHARLKALQHGHARLLGRRFGYDGPTWAFYANYLVGLMLVVWTGLVAGLLFALLGQMLDLRKTPLWLTMPALILAFYLMVWPVFAMRVQRVVWNHSRWGSIRFHCDLSAWPVWRLVLIHGPLVLLSLGLWWPVAAVAWARLRIESMTVLSEGQALEAALADLSAGAHERTRLDEAGDASADVMGLDLGW